FSILEFPVVAPAHADVAAIERGAGQQPFGDAKGAADPMPVFAVVNIRETSESRRERLPHLRFAYEARAPRLRSARHIERAIVGEELHDRVEIMIVARVEGALQCGL